MHPRNERASLATPIIVFFVSVYLLIAGVWLVLTRKIPSPGITRIFRSMFRAPYQSVLARVQPEEGLAWVADVPPDLLSDLESRSTLELFEDDRVLGPAHSGHAEIRTQGKGRYSHWGSQVYFSTSDGSDPRSNGRRYSVREARP